MKHVYLIQVLGMDIYKIGKSKKPSQRLKTVQTGNPYKCVVTDSYQTTRASQVENILHRRFALKKIDDNEFSLEGEWFKLDLQDVVDFKVTCEKIDKNLQVIEENSTLPDNKKGR